MEMIKYSVSSQYLFDKYKISNFGKCGRTAFRMMSLQDQTDSKL